MFSQKDYALHSKSFWIIDQNDSQIQLKHFSINGVSKIRKKYVPEVLNVDTNEIYKELTTIK